MIWYSDDEEKAYGKLPTLKKEDFLRGEKNIRTRTWLNYLTKIRHAKEDYESWEYAPLRLFHWFSHANRVDAYVRLNEKGSWYSKPFFESTMESSIDRLKNIELMYITTEDAYFSIDDVKFLCEYGVIDGQ